MNFKMLKFFYIITDSPQIAVPLLRDLTKLRHCLIRSFGLGFLAFSNFSNPFTRFSFVFATKFANSQRFFANFIQIFTQKFTNFTHFYGLLRLAFASLAMTTHSQKIRAFLLTMIANFIFFLKFLLNADLQKFIFVRINNEQ